MSSMGELTFFLGLQFMQKNDGIFISQDKYVADILKKFDFSSVKTASTPIEINKALLKDEEVKDVDVHLYRSMIGSLMYLTASRPSIMFAVCACARFQVTPKVSHLHAVKRIFRYLKGQPKLGLWYPRDSPFDLEAFSDSDYAGASLDRKSTTGGCQFLSKRLISWQCKKQIIVANSTTEAEYVAATNCNGHVLWIQNQMLDYRFNFMNTKIYIDNESTICIVKNLKPTESEGFEQIIDFLNASYVKYALTVNPTVYTLCIEQFWASAKVKNINGEAQIQALVDKKKVIITEASIKRDLMFKDKGGVDCLSNEVIFEQLILIRYEKLSQKLTFYKAFFSPQWKFLIHTILQCLSAKTTAWNEFSSIMASAIICLAINQNFNFSKYIFDNMVKHLDGGVKFLIHSANFVISSHTKKGFSNIKREGKDFSGKVTPLFATMMVQAPENVEIEVPLPSSESPNEEGVPTTSNDPLPSVEDRMKLNELMILCTNLQKQVLDLEDAKTAQAKEIASLKKRVKKLE
nr:uncharacterized mitochondrial protein AtMg00810-like [Tanacetum cinerariifolium]